MTMKLLTNPYSTSSQMTILLLGALINHKGAYAKQQVLTIVEGLKWFDLRQDDKIPYPTVQSKEPRWKTLIAIARRDCVESNFFEDNGTRDNWQISKKGGNVFALFRENYASGELDCSKCYMWSHVLKKHMNPGYSPSERDLDRPGDVYNDYYRTSQQEKYRNLSF